MSQMKTSQELFLLCSQIRMTSRVLTTFLTGLNKLVLKKELIIVVNSINTGFLWWLFCKWFAELPLLTAQGPIHCSRYKINHPYLWLKDWMWDSVFRTPYMASNLLVLELFQFGGRAGVGRNFNDVHCGNWICDIFWYNLCCLLTC